MSVDDALRDDARALAPDLIDLRRRLHRHPEVGLQLPLTQQMVLEALDGLGLEVSVGESSTSVTAVLRGASAGPSVLLRADMDGLPITEASNLEYASVEDGAMHACGHDLHTAMLVGAASLLASRREAVAGDVVFMFQPGEEGWDGAGHMLKEGVLNASGRGVSSAYGMHVMASIPSGMFTTRPGTLMAASAGLKVTVRGAGGHGSAPHHAKDPVSVAAQMVGDLQTLITRRFDVFDPVVLTVGSFHAGTARTIIPDEATFDATIRTFSHSAQQRIEVEAVRLCQNIAAAYGVEVDAVFTREYPPTINHPEHARFVESVIEGVFGDARYQLMAAPQPGAEDFSRVIAEVPGCYLMLGARVGADSESVPDNHSPRVLFDESVMPDGALLHAHLAIQALSRDASHESS
ncbi:MAG TPA: M20 family metallopeptidase [Jatrophihabitans sp.]